MATKSKEVAQEALRYVKWLYAVRAIVALAFGIVALVWPGLTLGVLLILVTIYLLVSGVINFVTGLADSGKRPGWALVVVLGIVEVALGVYIARHPLISLSTFLWLFGLVLIVIGVLEVGSAVLSEWAKNHRGWVAFSGLCSLIIGIIFVSWPVSSGLAFIWILGVYALIVAGVSMVASLEAGKAAKQLG